MALALLALSIDCGDAAKLAAFWAAALGRPADPGATPESAAITPGDSGATGPRLLFHQAPEPKTVKNRLHLDLISNTFEAESQRLARSAHPGSATSPKAPPAGRGSPTPKATNSTSSPAEKGLRRGVRTGLGDPGWRRPSPAWRRTVLIHLSLTRHQVKDLPPVDID